ncbi:MAG: DUF3300 domain-containing protein, partial [Desulfobacterales bacterium]
MKAYSVLKGLIGLLILFLLTEPLAISAHAAEAIYSRKQLSQMLAPVALYPDDLLSQVLMASTYPLEVVEADRWIKKHPLLTGANLDEALRNKDWDPSIKALCHIPTVLSLMSERLEETTNLGNAFLSQESEVMNVIQDLRHRAYQEGNLHSNDKQKVILKADGTIVIEPTDPQIVYVPYYNTRYVYGPWLYPAYPPWYWGPAGVTVGAGIYFWPNFYVGFGLGFGYWSYFDWPGRTIIINVHRRPRFIRPGYNWASHRGPWHHEPHHRRGFVYRHHRAAEQLGQYPKYGRNFNRGQRRFSEQHRENRLRRGFSGQHRGNRLSTNRFGGNHFRGSVTTGRSGPLSEGRRYERQRFHGQNRGFARNVPERREYAERRNRFERSEPGMAFGGIRYGRDAGRSGIRNGGGLGAMHMHGHGGEHGPF